MIMSTEEIKVAANSIFAMRNKPKAPIDRIYANSKYAKRVKIDAMVSKLEDDRDIEQDSL
jgi:hypothetical protein